MLGPYRDPVPTDPDVLPDTCVPKEGAAPCQRLHVLPCPPPARSLPPAFGKAFAGAATLLLLVASASMSAITWTVTSTIRSARTPHAGDEVAQQVVQQTDGRGPSLELVRQGVETHDVEVLWGRAVRLAGTHKRLTLARAVVASEALSGGVERARLVADRRDALRIADLDERSAAALVGLRRGDLLTAVNGFALRRPADATRAWQRIKGRSMVLELLRDGRRVALRIDRAS